MLVETVAISSSTILFTICVSFIPSILVSPAAGGLDVEFGKLTMMLSPTLIFEALLMLFEIGAGGLGGNPLGKGAGGGAISPGISPGSGSPRLAVLVEFGRGPVGTFVVSPEFVVGVVGPDLVGAGRPVPVPIVSFAVKIGPPPFVGPDPVFCPVVVGFGSLGLLSGKSSTFSLPLRPFPV